MITFLWQLKAEALTAMGRAEAAAARRLVGELADTMPGEEMQAIFVQRARDRISVSP